MRLALRGAIAAVAGAVCGATAFIVSFAMHPNLVLEMDRDLPRTLTGVHPPERHGAETFAWTGSRAELRVDGLSRRRPWRCTVRFRGGRPEPAAQPVVSLAIDGIALAARLATNEYQELAVTLPASLRGPGSTVLALSSSTVFVPGPGDQRELGVQVDWLRCAPLDPAWMVAPRRAAAAAAIGSAIFGAALALAGLSALGLIVSVLGLAATQAFPLATGFAPYGPYPDGAVRLTVWVAGATVLVVRALDRWRTDPLSMAARVAVAISAAALYVKLLGLLHPAKPVVDALFHAHRLEWVLSGRYYFTQPMPDGVQFPYAIALYLFAAPWSALADDYVALLRVVTCALEALAGGLLYVMVVRARGDRLMGAAAVALFHLVPIPYAVIGNANLTNAFGQSASLIAVIAAAVWPLRSVPQIAGLALIAAVALLSHVSTFGLLLVTLSSFAMWCWWLGGAPARTPARSIGMALAAAVVLSVVAYYGHFGDTYRTLARVQSQASAPAVAAQPSPAERTVARGAPPTPLATRAARALESGVRDFGWPILVLALAGSWRLWASPSRDRLTLALAAWGVAYVVFMGLGLLMPVRAQYERYAAEFIGRVHFAVYPAVVVAAGLGFAWAWRAGGLLRFASIVLVTAAFVGALGRFASWLDVA